MRLLAKQKPSETLKALENSISSQMHCPQKGMIKTTTWFKVVPSP